MRPLRIALTLACFQIGATASIFVVAICKDGVVAVADSRLAFTDIDSPTGRPLAYADGIGKITRFDSAILAATGQGFLAEERFDDFVRRFADASGPLEAESILPALLKYGAGIGGLRNQHMVVAKFKNGAPLICGYDGQFRPCVGQGYIQSSPTDFARLNWLSRMSATEVAMEARASMRRYIAATGKGATMGGDFSATLLTSAGARDLWTLRNPIRAHTLDELIALVRARKIQVTLVPPATRADLDRLLDSGPAQ